MKQVARNATFELETIMNTPPPLPRKQKPISTFKAFCWLLAFCAVIIMFVCFPPSCISVVLWCMWSDNRDKQRQFEYEIAKLKINQPR